MEYKYKNKGDGTLIKFIEFDERFKEKVIEFWIKICVEEYEFKEWEYYIRNMDNHTYKQNGGNFWIAIEDEEVVGTISLQNLGQGRGLLKSMYVHKEFRSKKIAYSLMNILLDFASENKYNKIELDTYKKFETAIKFYEKMGFVRKKEVDDKYIYEKEI